MVLEGQLQGTTLFAETKDASSELKLVAEVNRQVEPDSLRGSIILGDCNQPMPFVGYAVRDTRG